MDSFLKCDVCGKDELLIRIAKNMGRSIIGKEKVICRDCFLKLQERFGRKDYKEVEKFFFEPYQICSKHNQ
jgi:hypothetical protein